MAVRTFRVVFVAATLGACVPPSSPAVFVNSSASVVGEPPSGDAPELSQNARHIIVTVDKHIPRPTELIAVIDFHSAAQNEDKGFNELRAHAVAPRGRSGDRRRVRAR